VAPSPILWSKLAAEARNKPETQFEYGHQMMPMVEYTLALYLTATRALLTALWGQNLVLCAFHVHSIDRLWSDGWEGGKRQLHSSLLPLDARLKVSDAIMTIIVASRTKTGCQSRRLWKQGVLRHKPGANGGKRANGQAASGYAVVPEVQPKNAWRGTSESTKNRSCRLSSDCSHQTGGSRPVRHQKEESWWGGGQGRGVVPRERVSRQRPHLWRGCVLADEPCSEASGGPSAAR